MKIAVVIAWFEPAGGGAERSTAQTVHHLVQRGHRVTLLTGFCATEDQAAGLDVQLYPRGLSRSPWWYRGFSRWAQRQLDQGGYDASLSISTAVPASVVQPRGGTVRETLDRNIAMRPTPWRRLVKRTLINLSIKQRILLSLEHQTLHNPRVQRIVALSGYVTEQLQRHYHIDAARIQQIPNAAEAPQVTDQQRRDWRQRIRTGFQIPQGPPVFLFAAHNPKLKGLGPLMHATKLLQDRQTPITLLVAGNNRYAYQHLAATLGIRDRVRFIGKTNQMAQLYATADVTVLPTFYDPSSKVVIESLMMGTPAITTRYNGASQYVLSHNGHAPRGRVIDDPADVEALAQAMAQLADPTQRQRCIEAIDPQWAQSLSMSRHVDQLEQLLETVASGQPLANHE